MVERLVEDYRYGYLTEFDFWRSEPALAISMRNTPI